MRLIDADALKELFSEVIGHIAKKPEMNGNLEHMIRASAMVIQMIDDAPSIQLGANLAEVGTDLVSRQAVKDIFTGLYGISAIGSVFDKYEWADICETTANELPSVKPDDDRLERCRFEYVNACKILAHRTPDTRKKDINDAYAVVRALNPIFGEEGF